MKVIFLKDAKPHGRKDEIKEVKDGFAKYLISSSLAVPYTQKSNQILMGEIKAKELKQENDVKEADELKSKLEKVSLSFKVKTGKDEKVFGSVSSKQIHEELKKKGFEIDKKKIKVSEINTLGYHEIEIELHKKVNCKIKIHLEK
jgi:large subunit ribosomal protein L9